jgi:putative lipoprotein
MVLFMKTKQAISTLVIALLLFLLASCGGITLNDPLNGTAWTLTSINNSPPLENTTVTVEFKDGKIGGSSGCNSYGGFYKVSGEKITTDSIAMTLMACMDQGVMAQEQAFLEYLQEAQAFKLNEDQLQILSSNGKSLTFAPNP